MAEPETPVLSPEHADKLARMRNFVMGIRHHRVDFDRLHAHKDPASVLSDPTLYRTSALWRRLALYDDQILSSYCHTAALITGPERAVYAELGFEVSHVILTPEGYDPLGARTFVETTSFRLCHAYIAQLSHQLTASLGVEGFSLDAKDAWNKLAGPSIDEDLRTGS